MKIEKLMLVLEIQNQYVKSIVGLIVNVILKSPTVNELTVINATTPPTTHLTSAA